MIKHALFTGLFAAVIGLASTSANQELWTDDMAAAKDKAAKDKKDLLMDFTGSDWCGWCIRLDEEVFSKEAFLPAAEKFVLVKLDFPSDDSKIKAETKAQNEKLQKEYGVEGYPTIVLADESGRPYAKTGYEEGGPEKYLAHLAELRGSRDQRDAAFTKAASAEGMEKAKLLAEGLSKVAPEWHEAFYKSEIDTIRQLDTDDSLGFTKKAKLADQERVFQEKLQAAHPKLVEAIEAKNFGEALRTVDALIAESNLEGESKQRALCVKVDFFAMQDDAAGALALVKEIIAMDPSTDTARQLQEILPTIEEAMGKEGEKEESGETPAEKPADSPEPAVQQ